MCTPTSPSNSQNKKRKETADGDFASSTDDRILELESELLEKEKEIEEKDTMITKLKMIIEELKAKQQEAGVDDEDDLSDEEMELDSRNPWDSKFMQLREFRIMNGNCNVPQKVAGLGIWVKDQRANYRKGKISQDRIMLLESLGFSWGKNSQQQPMTFDEGLEELQKYKKAMGHCNIHVDSKSPSRLAKWVMAQRNEYKRFRKNKDSLLTLDQVGQLKEVGFKWKSSSRK